jgi:nucleotide-binding universal stress UspA family protein
MLSHLLVPLDGSPTAEAALPHAAALARLFGARITLARVPEVMVVPVASGGVWVTRIVEAPEAEETAAAELREAAARPLLAGLQVDCVTPSYPVAEGLLEAVAEAGADLVVMTTHGRGAAGRWVMGSVAGKLVHHSPVPLYVIRVPDGDAPAPRFTRLLVPLDGSETAEASLPAATALARAAGAEVRLVRIPTIPGYAKILPETAGWIPELLREQVGEAEDYLARVTAELERSGIRAAGTVELIVAGDIARGILEHAAEVGADVIVMSTHGRSGLGRWVMGSVADRLLEGADRPVWIVRPREG